MKRILIAALAAVGMVLAATGSASAVTTTAPNAADALQQLQANGYRVILNKTGDTALDQCTVLSARQGHPLTETVPAGGGDTMTKVVYTPVYVDVGCG